MNKLEIREKKAELKRVKKAYLTKMDKLRKELKSLSTPKPLIPKKVLNLSVYELSDISVRAFNVIGSALFTYLKIQTNRATIGDVIKISKSDFSKMSNCGAKTMSEIERALDKFGVSLSK